MYLVVLIITIKRRWEGLTKADFADVPFRLSHSAKKARSRDPGSRGTFFPIEN